MKFCKNCGCELTEGIRFCPKCGVDNIDPSILLAQKEALKNRPSFWEVNKKGILIAIVVFIGIVGACGGGYYYYQQQLIAQQQAVEKAAQEAAQKAQEEKIAAEKAAQEKKLEEENKKIKEGINNALEALSKSESELENLETNINAGSYNSSYYSNIRSQIFTPIQDIKDHIDELMPNNDIATKNEVLSLVDMQEKRANMLYRGIFSYGKDRGKADYDAAHQLTEKYNQKLNDFKAKYGM